MRSTLFQDSHIVAVVCVFLAPGTGWAQPRTIRVPADFPSIQAAIDNASTGVVDTVLVAPGFIMRR
jgi:hypothetical protein